MTRFYKGIAGRRGANPSGVVIHNDAGSVYANAAFYRGWLPSHDAENGFAHYYVASDGTFQAEDEMNMAWHTANSTGNAYYIGIEACQSMGPENIFRQNEENSIKLAAQILKRYGLQPNRNTVKLHKQFSPTSCPHRSVALHGDGYVMQDYFIARIKSYMGSNPTPAPTPAPGTGTRKYNIDLVNINSKAFQIKGWFTPAKATKGQDIWVYIMKKGGPEIARFKAKKIQRPDVQKAVSNPNGADVGFQVDAPTPEGVLGKDFDLLLRYNNDNKEEIRTKEHWKAPALINEGCLDKVAGDAKGVTFAGWHLNTRQKDGFKHYLFVTDAKTGKEYVRFDITGGSYLASPDIAKKYGPEIAQRSNCRFHNYCALAANHPARGKTVNIISRYAPAKEIDTKTSTDKLWGTYRL